MLLAGLLQAVGMCRHVSGDSNLSSWFIMSNTFNTTSSSDVSPPNAFQIAFKGNTRWLAGKLDVTDELLRTLVDKDVLKREHQSNIIKASDNARKVDVLLSILERRDDRLFSKFCDTLVDEGQRHVVDRLRSTYTEATRTTSREAGVSKNTVEVKEILEPNTGLSYRETPLTVQQLVVHQPQLPIELSATTPRHEVNEANNATEIELQELLEPDYGLPSKLFNQGIITERQRSIIMEERPVQSRVFNLLQAVKETFGNLNHADFLKALIDDGQEHVANFIKVNGIIDDITGDDRPLNQQQRRRLFQPCLLFELDLRDAELHDMMLRERVISSPQSKKVTQQRTEFNGNEVLLTIMMRRSVTNVKRFIVFLHKAGHSNAVEQLTKVGVITRLRTMIPSSMLSGDSTMEKEMGIAEIFKQSSGHLERCLWWPAQAQMEFERELSGMEFEFDMEIIYIELANSLHWHIICGNVQTLENIRRLYLRGSYSQLLNTIFNRLCRCENNEGFKLHVEWTAEDFEDCRSFFNYSRGQPFGKLTELIGRPDGGLPGISDTKASSNMFDL